MHRVERQLSNRSRRISASPKVVEWEDNYINVRELGILIEGFRRLDINVSEDEKLELSRKFDRRLHQEIEKLNLCLISVSGGISENIRKVLDKTVRLGGRLSDYSIKQLVLDGRPSRNLRKTREYYDELHSIGRELIKLTHFIDQNMYYIDVVIRNASKTFRTHLQVAGGEKFDLRNVKVMSVNLLLEALAIPVDYTHDVLSRSRLKTHVLSRCAAKFHISTILKDYHVQTIATFSASLAKKMDRLSIAEEYIIANSGINSDTETPQCRSSGYETIVELLQRIALIGNQNELLSRTLAEQSGAFVADVIPYLNPESRKDFVNDYERRRSLPQSNLFLNVLSAFLYIVSIYAPISTAGEYARSLGGTISMSGLLIGCSSFAGILSAPIYSKLANDNNFKPSLITASSICLLGNLVYASSASFNSVWMAVTGRCLIGLGGARAINRRYISDCAPLKDILRRNAEFVTASAIGMSAGPALAFIVNHFTSSDRDHYTSTFGLFFDRRTNTSWVLCLAWIIYIIFLYRVFEEPLPIRQQAREIPNTSFWSNYHSINRTEIKKKNIIRGLNNLKEELRKVYMVLKPDKPVQYCLVVYFVVKMIADLLLASTSSLMEILFEKDKNWADGYIASLGLFMWPVNMLVTKFKKDQVEDRKQLEAWHYIMLLGCISMILFIAKEKEHVIPIHLFLYFFTGTIIFVSSNAIEAVIYPSLKRLMPESLATGTFNSGLLSTQAGMLGRAAGDFLVWVMSDDNSSGIIFLWKLYFPCIVITSLLIYTCYQFWDILEPDDEIQALSNESSDQILGRFNELMYQTAQ